GGVQIFNILVNLARGKFVALILGPAGMGVSSLFTTSSAIIQQLGSLGLNLSIVKETAAAKDQPGVLHTVLHVARRLILLTSLLGALVCILLSPWLSRLTFGNYDYTFGFILLGIAVALSICGAGYLALLQGLGDIRRLSKASIVGSLTGLLCGVPLYYFFGTSGIVPAMIILSLAVTAFYYFSFRKSEHLPAPADTDLPATDINLRDHLPLIRKLISLGIVFMIGTLVGSAVNYLINTFIRWQGSLSDVGLFQGANSLTNQYMGIVFSALAMDYFPRISAIASDAVKLRHIVNRQSELVMLIATPIVMLVIVLAPVAIRMLLSDDFLSIIPLLRWLAMGVLLQGISFPLGYLFLAKDNKKIYIWLEVVSG
ncbi:MAG: oligosaccharide flippase family protein, partial [Muribaculaceae bacterium]|nr:oligosaccharide flippase family protein [Muribaculaceae bacterium]